ncbi:meprin A subunit beta-like [Engraulis encrasicolus]|uniref:meprin A subunit beta-like n=1 Tax=Engraulis encrasicolus TaxID=184585 RepID=UPI002FD005F4
MESDLRSSTTNQNRRWNTSVPYELARSLGYENNFEKVSEDFSSLLNTSYDYTSVMHYGENFFTNGNGSTILTKNPEFQDVIGNSVEMSPTDALELNRLYRCNASVTLRQNCSFEDESMCEMTVCSRGSPEWQTVSRTDGGPHSDHTYLGTEKQGSGLFMHFSTVKGNKGDSSRLITKRMTPTRPCQIQCLQFYYYYSGNKMDQLNIWIREFESKDDVEGTRRLMGQITGSPADYWQLHHVPLNASKTFQVEFEGRKGSGSSSGGFSVDDINLSETECPHHTWQIRNFEERLNSSARSEIYSPRYYTTDGYGYQIRLSLRSTYFGLYLRLVSGDYDDQLEWPFAWRQLSSIMVDQNPRMQMHMSKLRTITTDPGAMINAEQSLWDNPREVGTLTEVNGETFYASYAVGRSTFMTLDDLRKRDFLKGGDAVISFFMQDIRPLLTNNSLPCPGIPQQNFTSVPKDSDYSCSRVTTTTSPPTTTTPTTTTSPPTTTTTTTSPPTTTTPTTTTTITSPTTTTTTTTTTTSTTTTTTEGPDVDGNCDSFFCSFSPKTTCCPLVLLFTLLLLLTH